VFSNNIFYIVVSECLRIVSKPVVFTFVICHLIFIYGLWLVREKYTQSTYLLLMLYIVDFHIIFSCALHLLLQSLN
jgi:hypothetical protein